MGDEGKVAGYRSLAALLSALSALKPNSLSVIVRSTSESWMPRYASSMTFSATNLAAGSLIFKCKGPQWPQAQRPDRQEIVAVILVTAAGTAPVRAVARFMPMLKTNTALRHF
jgi:hypothetical protein